MDVDVEMLLQLVAAAVLGGLIGLEREMHDHPSGLRTHIAVTLGACLFGVVSVAGARRVGVDPNIPGQDVTRIAAQVVSGIGFLGGGAILKSGTTVKGLTSAAGLWVSAAVGLAVAFELYVEAAVTTVVLVAALSLLKRPRLWVRRKAMTRERVTVTIGLDQDPSEVISALSRLPDTTLRSLVVKRREEGDETAVQAEIEGRRGVLEEHLGVIADRADVLAIELG